MGDYADILAEARLRQILQYADTGVGREVAADLSERIVRAASSSAVKVQKGQVILTFDLLDGGAEPDAEPEEGHDEPVSLLPRPIADNPQA